MASRSFGIRRVAFVRGVTTNSTTHEPNERGRAELAQAVVALKEYQIETREVASLRRGEPFCVRIIGSITPSVVKTVAELTRALEVKTRPRHFEALHVPQHTRPDLPAALAVTNRWLFETKHLLIVVTQHLLAERLPGLFASKMLDTTIADVRLPRGRARAIDCRTRQVTIL